jgi:hypothetical protein
MAQTEMVIKGIGPYASIRAVFNLKRVFLTELWPVTGYATGTTR